MKNRVIYISFMIAVSLIVACNKWGNQDNSSYWGHGFSMGYGLGCYDDRAVMMNDLRITEEQADRIADIDAKYRKQYYEHRGNFVKIDSLRKEHRREIDNLLDKSQQTRFGRIYNRNWSDWGRHHGRRYMGDYYGHGYGMGYCSGVYSTNEYMKQNLGLDDAQIKKIDEIDAKYRELYYTNRNDFNKIDSLRVEHKKAIDKVLTEEQRKKFSDSYENRWRGWGHGRGMGPGMMGY